jgi:hypothetical protein
MAITTGDGLKTAQLSRDRVQIKKTAARTTVALIPFSMFDVAGDPGAGTLTGTSVAAGVVPTDATAGCPAIAAFGGGATGYISRIKASNSVASVIELYDLLWKGGAYPFNAAQALTGQPSYAGRLPNTNYQGCEIWFEAVTAFTGVPAVTVQYTNEAGTTGKSTGAVSPTAAPIVGRMQRLPLAAGDKGVQAISNVACATATVGTFNILVMRKLGEWRISTVGQIITEGPDLTGLTQVYTDSALFMVVTADSTAAGLPYISADIVNG